MASTPPSDRTPPEGNRLPWLDTAGGPAGGLIEQSPIGGSLIRWLLAIGILILVAVGAFLFGRGRNDTRPLPHVPSLATSSVAPTRQAPPELVAPAPATPPASHPPTPPALQGPSHAPQTAPALARAGAEQARRTAIAPALRPEATLHLRPEQVRAVRQIARDARANIHRDYRPKPEVQQAYSPTAGPSGHVVQLGAYQSAAEAEAAAALFRYKYRGLLATLPKAVLPFRPKNSRKMFYRVQFITPSQVYAEVTCQRLRGAAKTCIVVY